MKAMTPGWGGREGDGRVCVCVELLLMMIPGGIVSRQLLTAPFYMRGASSGEREEVGRPHHVRVDQSGRSASSIRDEEGPSCPVF